MLKDIFQRGKCLVGLHQGPWQFSAEKICTKVQICTVCKAKSEKPEHAWSDWASAQACDFVRKCSRCGITETKTEHVWGAPAYATDGECSLHRSCSRCAATEPAGTRHVMEAWLYGAEGACTQTIACSRCGGTGSQTRTQHEWNVPVHSTFYGAPVAVCGRCGEMHVPADGGVSFQQSAKAVRAIMSAVDTTAFITAARQHAPVLSAPATTHYLRLATERFSVDAAARARLGAAAKFAEVCRSGGVETAIAKLLVPQGAATESAAAATTAASSGAVRPAPAASPSNDDRLDGHWRHTEHMSSGGVSMATDTHLVLASDGSAACWSHSAGSFGETRSGKEYGTWRTSNGRLSVDAGLSYSGRYTTDGARLVLPDSGRYRFWEKVR